MRLARLKTASQLRVADLALDVTVRYGVDLFSLPKVAVGKLAQAWGWCRQILDFPQA